MNYYERSCKKIEELRGRNDYLILSIESSCDETAVAVVRGREVLGSVISSQIEIHKRFGGVVPEIASRNHVLAIDNIVDEVLEKAKTLRKMSDASIRTALVYDGHLAKSIPADGFFDFIIPASKLLGRN